MSKTVGARQGLIGSAVFTLRRLAYADGATRTQESGRIIMPLLLNEGRRIGSVSQHALRLEQ